MKSHYRSVLNILIGVSILFGLVLSLQSQAQATSPEKDLEHQVSAYDLIAAMNVLRMSYGLPGLIEDPIINAVAQTTAQIMADGLLSWHIGDVRGRLAAAGYGEGGTVWATENFAVGSEGMTIDQIMIMWSDESHMLPAVKPYYCNVGAGTATAANGMTYFILQAAYVSGQECGTYTSPGGYTDPSGEGGTVSIPGIVTPVELVEPDEDGNYLHVVKPGQSFWSIAVAYKVTIKQIREWNGLSEAYVLQPGDAIKIKGPDSAGMATATPMGAVSINTPDPDGKIIHTVQAYQTLTTISQAYGVSVETLLKLNGIAIDTPLQIGQSLVIQVSSIPPTATQRPLTPIEMLTPAADGKYYHVVKEGQNPTWIADYYGVPLADLLAWNFLNQSSVVYPGEQLLLNVTPPATVTPTAPPATETPRPTPTTLPTATSSPTASISPTENIETNLIAENNDYEWVVPIIIALVIGVFLFLSYIRKKSK